MHGREISSRFYRSDEIPCKNCEERHIGCHSNCEEYKAFREMIEERTSKYKKEHLVDSYRKDVSKKLTSKNYPINEAKRRARYKNGANVK